MTPAWNETPLGSVGRWGLTALVILALFLLSTFPFRFAGLGEIRPAFMLMAVYYWTILRPSLLPPPAVFAIGIVLDVLFAYPLGMNAMVFVIAQWVTRGQRKFLLGQPFPVIWAGFALMALGSGVAQWLVFSLFSGTLVPVRPVVVGTLLSVFLFPAAALPLSVAHKALVDRPPSAS